MAGNGVRLFVGVPGPPSELYDDVARRLIASGGRPVPPGSHHVTVRFFGELPDASRAGDAVAESLVGQRAIPAIVAGLGGFPSLERARIAWLGVDAPGLAALAGRVRRWTRDLGQPEDKPFHAHITVARFNGATDLGSLDLAASTTGLLDLVVLYRSQLGPAGPSYEALRAWRLPHP